MEESKPVPFSLILGVVVPLIGLGLCIYLLQIQKSAPTPSAVTAAVPAVAHADYQNAVVLYQQGQLPEAEKLLQSSITRGEDIYLSRHLLGIILGQMGRYDEAIQQFQTITQMQPQDAGAFCNWGEALRRSDRSAEAIIPLEKAVELVPGSTIYQFKLRLAQIEAGQGEALAAQAGEETKKAQPPGDWLMTAAALALAEHKWDLAATLLRQAKDILKPEILSDLLRDQAFHRYANQAELAGIFQQTVVVQTPGPLTQQALQAYTTSNFAKGLKLLNQAEQAKENPGPLYTTKGAVFISKGDFAQAVEAFRKATEASPQDSTLQLNLAEALRGNNQSKEAAQVLQKALVLSPGNEIYAVKLAFALIETGQAKEVLDQGLSKANAGPLLIAKAAAAARLGDIDEASAELKRARDTLPPGTYTGLLQDPVFRSYREEPDLRIYFNEVPKAKAP